MSSNNRKAATITLRDFTSVPMRAFHLSWAAFFLCFFAWFGIAPLMAVVREEMSLTQEQVGNTIIASVLGTIGARLLAGWFCDRFGPRRTYSWLLVLGSLPVMGIGLSQSYESFLAARFLIGFIGASFVVTQYHTSVMFAPNVVGTANALTAGWGNLGGGVTQMVMPLVFSLFISAGVSTFWSWRASMIVAGILCATLGLLYARFTQDTPEGNFSDLRREGKLPHKPAFGAGVLAPCKDLRVWALFVIYGSCFGVELTIHNIAALYFMDYFDVGLKTAGLVAGLFGTMNLFARFLGGLLGDRVGTRYGPQARVLWLGGVLLLGGIALMVFSRATHLPVAVGCLLVFGLFIQMSSGATFSVVPFINPKALGTVTGVVGAGGNSGAVVAGLLLKNPDLSWPDALWMIGVGVTIASLLSLAIRIPQESEAPTVPEALPNLLKVT